MHFAKEDCFAKKSGGLSTRRAAHLHSSHGKARISRECPEDVWRPGKMFHERYSKVKMIITRKIDLKLTRTWKKKISLSLTFQIQGILRNLMHKPSNVSSSLLCYERASKDSRKNAKHNRFPRQFVSARWWYIISNPPCRYVHISKSVKALNWSSYYPLS